MHCMQILIYSDETIDLNTQGLASGLEATTGWSVGAGGEDFTAPTGSVHHPYSYEALPKSLLIEAHSADLAVFFTRVPYDNNFFYMRSGNLAIVSFYAWEQLTSLPLENGAIYFIMSLLRSSLPLAESHGEISGCVHDFLWAKRGVDIGMRAGHFCSACKATLADHGMDAAQQQLFDNIDRVLGDLSSSSRADRNVIESWASRPHVAQDGPSFDVFICHNVEDKDEVRQLARTLSSKGVRVWLDEEQLRPGLAWQIALEDQISSIRTAAIFVGSSGLGPWQDLEMRAFLAEFNSRQCPVIPVILQSASSVPKLPIFLRQVTWVDFRENQESAMKRLLWGITGRKA